jgi:hypothetical protein
MDSRAIRTLYAYHFALNRRLGRDCIGKLGDEQFARSGFLTGMDGTLHGFPDRFHAARVFQ